MLGTPGPSSRRTVVFGAFAQWPPLSLECLRSCCLNAGPLFQPVSPPHPAETDLTRGLAFGPRASGDPGKARHLQARLRPSADPAGNVPDAPSSPPVFRTLPASQAGSGHLLTRGCLGGSGWRHPHCKVKPPRDEGPPGVTGPGPGAATSSRRARLCPGAEPGGPTARVLGGFPVSLPVPHSAVNSAEARQNGTARGSRQRRSMPPTSGLLVHRRLSPHPGFDGSGAGWFEGQALSASLF